MKNLTFMLIDTVRSSYAQQGVVISIFYLLLVIVFIVFLVIFFDGARKIGIIGMISAFIFGCVINIFYPVDIAQYRKEAKLEKYIEQKKHGEDKTKADIEKFSKVYIPSEDPDRRE